MTDQELLQAIGQVVEAKIEPLRQDICELKEQVGHLESRMDRLEEKVDRLESRMDRLEERVGRLESRMDRLESRMDSLEETVGGLKTTVAGLESRVGTLEEQMTCVRVYMDTELDRTLKLLLEGQQAVWDRAVPPERYDALEVRTSALEMAVKQHSQEIQELKLA